MGLLLLLLRLLLRLLLPAISRGCSLLPLTPTTPPPGPPSHCRRETARATATSTTATAGSARRTSAPSACLVGGWGDAAWLGCAGSCRVGCRQAWRMHCRYCNLEGRALAAEAPQLDGRHAPARLACRPPPSATCSASARVRPVRGLPPPDGGAGQRFRLQVGEESGLPGEKACGPSKVGKAPTAPEARAGTSQIAGHCLKRCLCSDPLPASSPGLQV